jgi:VanZ family protein
MSSKLYQNLFRFICVVQLFVATGICILYSDKTQVALPNVFGIDKVLHCGAYLIYGLSLQVAIIATAQNKLLNKYNVIRILTFLLGVLFAVSDEIHQSFVPGRNSSVYDLIADAIGLALSLFLCKLVVFIYTKITKSTN